MGCAGNVQYFRQRYGRFAALFCFSSGIVPFLVPVLCMRLFAEERRSGTLELLLTRPVSVLRIVSAKYLAGLLLVLLSILPTIIYPVSLWFLSMPARAYRYGRNRRLVYRIVFPVGYLCCGLRLGFRRDR